MAANPSSTLAGTAAEFEYSKIEEGSRPSGPQGAAATQFVSKT
jgi:hypothetical protein